MAKLLLKFEDQVVQEVYLFGSPVTIGRQPDNVLPIDNPAVSGYHAKVYVEGGHYVLEDTESFNGTYIHNQRISKVVLKNGDKAIIGKHTLEFQDEARQGTAYGWSAGAIDGQAEKPKPPKLDRTVLLDTAKGKELMALAVAAASASGPAAAQKSGTAQSQGSAPAAPVVHKTVGTLTIVEGKTDQSHYLLTGRLTVIGKSKMAGIRLKRWFAPRVAASIYRTEDGYYIAASEDKVKVNDEFVESGKKLLEAGQVIEVAGIKAVFGFCEA